MTDNWGLKPAKNTVCYCRSLVDRGLGDLYEVMHQLPSAVIYPATSGGGVRSQRLFVFVVIHQIMGDLWQ